MPLDGIFLHHLTDELGFLTGCRADKIHQPSRDELVLLLRSAGFSGKLLISTRSGSARVHLTSATFDNPAEPPTFCRLLRRHLSSAKITAVEQAGLDRILFIRFMTYNEMGDTIYPFLAVELITGRANVVLCDENGRILDALHRSDIESSARLIQPGAKYTLPEKEDKLDPFTASAEELSSAVSSSKRPISSAFTAAIDGVSPLVSRELAFRLKADPDLPANELSESAVTALCGVAEEFKKALAHPLPVTVCDGDGTVRDFCYLPIKQYGGEGAGFEALSALLDGFYADRDRDARMKTMAQDVLKTVNNLKNRTERKLSYRLADLEKCKNREQYRIWGELLKANLYAIEKGSASARVQNYYDENMGYIDIPLDPAVSPAANAAKYFKEYKKSYTAEQTLTGLIEADKKELIYLDSVLDSLSRITSAAELSEIKEELYDAGYIRRTSKQRPKAASPRPKEFLSPSGFKIMVGRNNRENDLLTLKLASKQDIWFHTKNIPGSHVVLFTEGDTPSDKDLFFAACLAAGHSKAAKSDNVPVDFTEIKNLKKPSGAKPGMVIYTTNRTIYAKPREN